MPLVAFVANVLWIGFSLGLINSKEYWTRIEIATTIRRIKEIQAK
jgi:hypothetical protein